MYQYTSKGYKFIEYEKQEPTQRMKILSSIAAKGYRASIGKEDNPPSPPYKRQDYRDAWWVGVGIRYEEVFGELTQSMSDVCDIPV